MHGGENWIRKAEREYRSEKTIQWRDEPRRTSSLRQIIIINSKNVHIQTTARMCDNHVEGHNMIDHIILVNDFMGDICPEKKTGLTWIN